MISDRSCPTWISNIDRNLLYIWFIWWRTKSLFFKHFQGTSSSSSKQPPYSPRSSLLSPVKFGDQLQPQLKAVQPPSGSSYTSYRLPSYSRDNLIEKLRQVRICNSITYLLSKIVSIYYFTYLSKFSGFIETLYHT